MVISCEVLSPGVAEGQLLVMQTPVGASGSRSPRQGSDPQAETQRFAQQVAALGEDLQQIVGRLESQSLSAEADIVRVHLMMLHDRKFQKQIEELIQQEGLAAHVAVGQVAEELLRRFESMQDSFLAERAADLRDLAKQLEHRLLQDEVTIDQQVQGVADPVLVMEELLPSIVLRAKQLNIRAIVVEKGTGFSHGAILARAFALPVVRVGSLGSVSATAGRHVLVDGDHHELLVEPAEQELRERRGSALGEAPMPVRRRHPTVRLWVSIVDPRQLEKFDWREIEGVGLYRTETLFMLDKLDFPSEDEQVAVYRRVFELCESRPVTIRTMDLGGDKAVPYLSASHEDNPYLGLRAHRICRFHPELLVTQMRAILRAAKGPHRLRLMFPMIESLDQWRFVQGLVSQTIDGLRSQGLEFQEEFEQGVLVETPSAVWDFSRLLRHIDFAGAGTNDLVQYLFAVERNNANVADLYQPEHPIVLRVLRQLARQARGASKSFSICGEMARCQVMLPLLVGLGLRDMTVGVQSVQAVSERLSTLRMEDCRRLARYCLRADTVQQVRSRLGGSPERTDQEIPHGQAVDPVCRMAVRKLGNPFSVVREGVAHYFCSSRCMSRFASEKENRIGAATGKDSGP